METRVRADQFQPIPAIDGKLNEFADDALILDAGGWFKPCNRATHVVDKMPYETRGAKLQTGPLPGERFTKATWYQVDFVDPQMRFPFADKYFDFSVCSHTLEDLENPTYLIAELIRVSKAGYVETPSRLVEQSMAVTDNFSAIAGHPHHHWIVDQDEGRLIFYRKADSINKGTKIPYRTYNLSLCAGYSSVMSFFWSGRVSYEMVVGKAAEIQAANFKRELSIPAYMPTLDAILRLRRRVMSLVMKEKQNPRWWDEIKDLSETYSSISLKEVK